MGYAGARMPLVVRPMAPADAAGLRARFPSEGRAPWLRLPPPYTWDALLGPQSESLVPRFVAEASGGRLVGWVGVDARGEAPFVLGPLVGDDQLADLVARPLVSEAIAWASAQGLGRLWVKLDAQAQRPESFFKGLGFQAVAAREVMWRALAESAPPAPPPPGPPLDGQSPPVRVTVLAELHPLDWQDFHAALEADADREGRRDWTEAQAAEHLAQAGLRQVGAIQQGRLVGLAEFVQHGHSLELTHLALLPAQRGQGLAKQLLLRALNEGPARWGAREVKACLLSADAPALGKALAAVGGHPERELSFLVREL